MVDRPLVMILAILGSTAALAAEPDVIVKEGFFPEGPLRQDGLAFSVDEGAHLGHMLMVESR